MHESHRQQDEIGRDRKLAPRNLVHGLHARTIEPVAFEGEANPV